MAYIPTKSEGIDSFWKITCITLFMSKKKLQFHGPLDIMAYISCIYTNLQLIECYWLMQIFMQTVLMLIG